MSSAQLSLPILKTPEGLGCSNRGSVQRKALLGGYHERRGDNYLHIQSHMLLSSHELQRGSSTPDWEQLQGSHRSVCVWVAGLSQGLLNQVALARYLQEP